MNNKTNMRERLKMSTRAYLNIYTSFPLFYFKQKQHHTQTGFIAYK